MKQRRIYLILGLMLSLLACSKKPHYQFQGYVEGQNIYLSSPYGGMLIQLVIHRGERVSKDQLIAQLDPNPQALTVKELKHDLQQAQSTLIDLKKPRRKEEIDAIKAQIDQVKADIKLAAVRVNRFQTLYKKLATDKDTLDASIAKLEGEKAQLAQFQANLALAEQGARPDQIQAQEAQVKALTSKLKDAEWQLQQKTILAPAPGEIFDTYYRQGEYVPNQQAIASLLSPANIFVQFFVPVEVLPALKLNQVIYFTCANCPENQEAKISYISPEAEFLPPLVYSRENDDKLVFRIKARPRDPLSLKPGQPLTVIIP